jgi:hypothetical protein
MNGACSAQFSNPFPATISIIYFYAALMLGMRERGLNYRFECGAIEIKRVESECLKSFLLPLFQRVEGIHENDKFALIFHLLANKHDRLKAKDLDEKFYYRYSVQHDCSSSLAVVRMRVEFHGKFFCFSETFSCSLSLVI